MNPTLNPYQSLLVSRNSNKADLQVLLDACEDYMLNKTTATQIIAEVVSAVKEWKSLATRSGIARHEMDLFGEVFENRAHMRITL